MQREGLFKSLGIGVLEESIEGKIEPSAALIFKIDLNPFTRGNKLNGPWRRKGSF